MLDKRVAESIAQIRGIRQDDQFVLGKIGRRFDLLGNYEIKGNVPGDQHLRPADQFLTRVDRCGMEIFAIRPGEDEADLRLRPRSRMQIRVLYEKRESVCNVAEKFR